MEVASLALVQFQLKREEHGMARRITKLKLRRAALKKKNPWAEIKNSTLNAVALSRIGNGEIGYIRKFSYREARIMFPAATGLKKKETYFVLFGADGTSMWMTADSASAFEHAICEDLEVAHVH